MSKVAATRTPAGDGVERSLLAPDEGR